jgi:hypothetical protein
MANGEHLEILKQGVEQWNEWRREHPDVAPDLSEGDLAGAKLVVANLIRARLFRANLSGADLSAANLSWADLNGAHLVGADLGGANLSRAHLIGANLGGASLGRANLREARLVGTIFRDAVLANTDLNSADLTYADLSGAHFRSADLTWANLYLAKLIDVDFTEAVAARTNFADIDLSTAKGLETIQHNGPSTIGIDTIYKSRGKIPEAFLRGCGAPDEFIAYIGSMVGRPIEFFSCFISYSTKDQEFAERLHADLQAKGVRCWFAPHDVKGGEKLDEQIDKAIRLHDKLLLILSNHSIKSEWVKTEIAKARNREVKERKRVLFPVRLVAFGRLRKWEYFDADIGKSSAREIREYFIPDFSNWKDHDSYQTAFQRLVKDLKAGSESRPHNSVAG